jgi:hypothetical protein
VYEIRHRMGETRPVKGVCSALREGAPNYPYRHSEGPAKQKLTPQAQVLRAPERGTTTPGWRPRHADSPASEPLAYNFQVYSWARSTRKSSKTLTWIFASLGYPYTAVHEQRPVLAPWLIRDTLGAWVVWYLVTHLTELQFVVSGGFGQ